jgi:hypothetical protein
MSHQVMQQYSSASQFLHFFDFANVRDAHRSSFKIGREEASVNEYRSVRPNSSFWTTMRYVTSQRRSYFGFEAKSNDRD